MDSQTVVTKKTEEISAPNSAVTQQTVSTQVRPDQREFSIFKLSQVVWYILGLINIIIFLRFLFLLLAAGNAGFVRFIYDLSQIFVEPFLGIFPSARVETSYFEVASLVAIVVYTIFGFIINGFIELFSKRTEEM
jgi:hypothetical protein